MSLPRARGLLSVEVGGEGGLGWVGGFGGGGGCGLRAVALEAGHTELWVSAGCLLRGLWAC